MIETRAGLNALDAILAVDGLDGIFVGPNDLSLAMGKAPKSEPDDKAVRDAIAHICTRAPLRREKSPAFSALTEKPPRSASPRDICWSRQALTWRCCRAPPAARCKRRETQPALKPHFDFFLTRFDFTLRASALLPTANTISCWC